MMRIKHVLKSGMTVETVKGHRVTRKDAEAVYKLLECMNKKEGVLDEKENFNAIHCGGCRAGLA